MIRALVALGKWLDARFPVKVTITETKFHELCEVIDGNAERLGGVQSDVHRVEERLAKLEDSVQAIKDLLAKAATAGAQAEKRRSDFIAQGRMSD